MRANPILKKELVLGARSIKFPLALVFYSGCLSVTALVTLDSLTGFRYYYGGIDFETLTSIFMILAYMQLVNVQTFGEDLYQAVQVLWDQSYLDVWQLDTP